jgi:hypothetical protein
METRSIAEGIAWQAEHSERNDAPVTARVIRGMLALIGDDTATGRRMRDWQRLLLEDAMPLRLAGGFHYLHLTGADDRIGAIYDGGVTDQAEIDAILVAVTRDHDAALLPWFDGPPQTNEAGRSAGIVAGLLWLAAQGSTRFELNEIGASAGANTMIERYRYDLVGVQAGPADSPLTIRPEWRGPPPPDVPFAIESIAGCDLSPIDLADPAAAMRLRSYVWPENQVRLDRLDKVIAFARERRPDVVKAGAGDWVAEQLARPRAEGVTRVLYHSIVWQYLPVATRDRIELAMAEAGARATPERPLAWIQLETNRETFRHELRVRCWPAHPGWALLGQAQAHGAWVEWYGD